MSGWHSLQGYLGYRSSGALGRLKGKKRLWFVFDESNCQLLFYKSEVEAGCGSKPATGVIEMRSAAIALNVDDPNQFVIHSLGKEYILTAETHESTMIWLLALQSKRDAFNNRVTIYTDRTPIDYKEREELKRKESLPSDHELRQMIHRAMCAEDGGPLSLLRSQSERRERRSVGPNSHLKRRMLQQQNGSSSSLCSSRAAVVHRQSIDLGRVSGLFPMEMLDSRTRSAGSLGTTDSDDPEVFVGTSSSLSVRVPTTKYDENGLRFGGISAPALLSPLRRADAVETDGEDYFPLHQTSRSTTFSQDDHLIENMGSCDYLCSEKEDIDQSDKNITTKELEVMLKSSKMELEKSLSRESSLQLALEEKDQIIKQLEIFLKETEEKKHNTDSMNGTSGVCGGGGSGCNLASSSGSQEKCRILQNQNRFLNEEVLKLSRMWQQEKMNFLQQSQRIRELEVELDHLKKDYVFLLQSSIRTAGGDGPDFIEVPIYGGAKHKDRITRLLDDARKVNPSLPSLEGMAKSGCHVDSYGFKHCYVNEGLMLHYLCGQLHQHYAFQLVSSEKNQRRWKEILQHPGNVIPRTKEVKKLVRSGIPSHFRARVWGLLIHEKVRDIRENKGQLYYNQLCSLISDSETVAHNRRQISLDLLRTMPSNVHFNEANSDGVKKMQEVLQVFCLHNPEVGYCQGMNFIVGMALLFMKPDDAFWFLVAITERYFPPHYFDQNLMGAQADQDVLKNLLALKMPNLSQHFRSSDIELSTVTLNWFLAIFFDSVPLETLLRIWDCFLYEGPKVLFRFSVAILKMTEVSLLERTSTISIMRQLKASSRLCYDVEGLMRTAFEDLKPFPRRAEIVSKQACYLKTLKEKHKKRNLEKEVMETKEKLLDGLEAQMDTTATIIECAAVIGNDVLWLCEGHQSNGRIMEVSATDGTMQWLDIQLDSRIMCLSYVPEANVMLLGSLSHCLYAYDITTRECLWRTTLNDAVLSVCWQDDPRRNRIYAALADGTVAVVQRPIARLSTSSPSHNAVDIDYDVFYIMVGSGPVSCLSLVERRLWCACGNRIVILHARTLDIIDQFTVSSNSLDIVSSITDSKHGVWILLRGSSALQLWDPQNLVCRTIFDVKENKCPKAVTDTGFNTEWRITSVLPVEGTLWVGTGNGHLLVYEVHKLPSRRTSAFNSPRDGGGGGGGGIEERRTSMDLVTKRIEELYLNQKTFSHYEDGDHLDDRLKQIRGRSDSGYQTVGDGSKDSSTCRHEPEEATVVQCDECELENELGDLEEDKTTSSCDTATILGETSTETSPTLTAAPKSLLSDGEPSPLLSSNEKLRVSVLPRILSSSPCRHVSVRANSDGNPVRRRTERPPKVSKRASVERAPNLRRLNHSMSTYELSTWVTSKVRWTPSTSSSLSSSPPPPPQLSNRSNVGAKCHRRSYDDVSHLLGGSGDSLFSSPTCDSFDYDDVFVSYTEDERWARSVEGQRLRCTFKDKLTVPPLELPRFVLLTDDGSTGGDGGSSSGGPAAYLGASNCSNRRRNSTRRTLERRRKERLISEEKSPPHHQSKAPPLLVIGAADCSRGVLTSVATSLEDLSSASHVEYDSVQDGGLSKRNVDRLTIGNNSSDGRFWKGSDSGSFISFSESDVPYSVELTLKEKQKVADKPVRCLIGLHSESMVVSCAGSCNEPKSIMKWTTDKSDTPLMLWNSKAIVCVHYSESNNSSKCNNKFLRSTSPSSANSLVHATSNFVGSGLARVQTIISNLGSEMPIS